MNSISARNVQCIDYLFVQSWGAYWLYSNNLVYLNCTARAEYSNTRMHEYIQSLSSLIQRAFSFEA